MYATSCEAVEVNPAVTSETFRLNFPKGVYVTDYVNKMWYVEGSPTDRQTAMQKFSELLEFEANCRTNCLD